jgi:hypothetical protein
MRMGSTRRTTPGGGAVARRETSGLVSSFRGSIPGAEFVIFATVAAGLLVLGGGRRPTAGWMKMTLYRHMAAMLPGICAGVPVLGAIGAEVVVHPRQAGFGPDANHDFELATEDPLRLAQSFEKYHVYRRE